MTGVTFLGFEQELEFSFIIIFFICFVFLIFSNEMYLEQFGHESGWERNGILYFDMYVQNTTHI